MIKTVKNIDSNNWKIVFIKTIDNIIPIYYRILNLATFETENIPTHRMVDKIINDKINIINISVKNSEIVIINEDGYESSDEVIVVDEFENSVQSVFDWTLKLKNMMLDNDNIGSEVISRFDSEKNKKSPSNSKIDSDNKIAWTCEKEHTIKCDFASFYSLGCKCPICEIERNGETPSLNYWAHITDNLDILQYYEDADENLASSNDIGWKERRKVFFKKNNELQRAFLSDITAKHKSIGFTDEK